MDGPSLKHVEEQKRLPSSDEIRPTIGAAQSDPADPSNIPMLRVLFQSRRTMADEDLDIDDQAKPVQPPADENSANLAADNRRLREELREAKIKLLQAENERKRLQQWVKSLEKELSQSYQKAQMELGIWEEEVVELRPLKKQVELLTKAHQLSEARRLQTMSENGQLLAEIEQAKKQSWEITARRGDGTDTKAQHFDIDAANIEEVHGANSSELASTSPNGKEGTLHPVLFRDKSDSDVWRKILSHIPYPDGIHGPKQELTLRANAGYPRYDREFLQQFQPFCQEKPASLPPWLEVMTGGPAELTGIQWKLTRGPRIKVKKQGAQ
ncbi:hypothetical protein CVT24_003491 [Panaeolus cyanescens]|uniref:Eukaryotic translation initiation factor 4G1 eIF4E-binding domain-containing protein n=1 Tax=Panaeolus cyanescens TaxID=181874 RepID=A0A409Y7Q2_9AGAR|nr:hypothetical protein CVT24_003491 [Panaeolus cyanescens]